jgi:hypothetical protein
MAANTLASPPKTLAELWMHASLVAPRWMLVLAGVAGCAGLTGFALDRGRWTYSMMLVVLGCFGARGLMLLERSAWRRRALIVLDAVALGSAVLLVLQALNAVFGGTVGLIRA